MAGGPGGAGRPGGVGGPSAAGRPSPASGPGAAGGPGGVGRPNGPAAPDAARTRLVDELRDRGRLTSPAVEAAFRAVPRHAFLPEMAASQAYQDEAFVIKTGEDGLPVSSSSQPAIMAIMLEQLGVARGHRVLEIGTGTGYNAALLAHLVGPEGSVVTVDIDSDLVARARANLASAGYHDVTVVCGDGGFGAPGHAPYDRIIVTAGASDLAPSWLAQLGPDGRIALPLSLRGIQLCIALERSAGHWQSRAACRCGFIRMAGSLASPESYAPLGPQPGLHVQTEDGRPPAADALDTALTGPYSDVLAGVRVGGLPELGEADLWVTVMEPGLARLTITGRRPQRGEALPMLPFGMLATSDSGPGDGSRVAAASGVAGDSAVAGGTEAVSGSAAAGGSAVAGGFGVAGLLPATPPSAARPEYQEYEVVVRGFGPGGAVLAERLAGRVAAWQASGRPLASALSVSAYPHEGPGQDAPVVPASPGQAILDRPHTRLVLAWPSPPS
jgi:protein-L-isoaspartate(D-aspartate) O-methyltransferase